MNNEGELIEKAKDEIEEIEFQIRNENKINFKNKLIKNLKLTKNISRIILPYIIVPMISYEMVDSSNHSPFISEDQIEYQKTVKSIDNFGNVTEYSQYEKYNDTYNIVYYYGKWYQNSDGNYERKIKKYYLDTGKIINDFLSKSNDEIIDIINSDDFLEEEYIIDNNQELFETKNILSQEEIDESPSIKIILYYENRNKCIVRSQTLWENFIDSLKYILLTATMELLVSIIQKKKRKEIIEKNRKYKDEFVPLDTNTLKKKLKIRKDNLNRLMG